MVANHRERAELATREAVAPRRGMRSLMGRVAALFPRNAVSEAVDTTAHLSASPGEVWDGILFYEDVPREPLLFLRLFVPRPVRSEGDKTRVGATIRCTYEGGHLLKRITAAEPGRSVEFEVLEQRLGIENSISMGCGSYRIRAADGGSDVTLTTHYTGHLRPRWLWRPLERYLAHQVHGHILRGMRSVIGERAASALLAAGAVPASGPLVAPTS